MSLLTIWAVGTRERRLHRGGGTWTSPHDDNVQFRRWVEVLVYQWGFAQQKYKGEGEVIYVFLKKLFKYFGKLGLEKKNTFEK